jgi:hypothetical protein
MSIAYADQLQAATMPSETRVSIEADRCRALRSAAWWNGHAAQAAQVIPPMANSTWIPRVVLGTVVTVPVTECPGQ